MGEKEKKAPKAKSEVPKGEAEKTQLTPEQINALLDLIDGETGKEFKKQMLWGSLGAMAELATDFATAAFQTEPLSERMPKGLEETGKAFLQKPLKEKISIAVASLEVDQDSTQFDFAFESMFEKAKELGIQLDGRNTYEKLVELKDKIEAGSLSEDQLQALNKTFSPEEE